MTKILICGFPHCGTTILKCIVGHCTNVEEIVNETYHIPPSAPQKKKFTLCKWPFIHNSFFDKEYKDYIKIFIVRNPVYVFSSLNKRFQYNIPVNHSLPEYAKVLYRFKEIREKGHENTFVIRYEDLFQNNFQALKRILSAIGIEYTDDIFNNANYVNQVHTRLPLPGKEAPPNVQHEMYRNWQINQPFVSNNDPEKIDLVPRQKDYIRNSDLIVSVYPEVLNLIK